ncbi:MAG: lipopolysaccharide biosynthesis protein [Bacteroidaceae bacterium]|nr:lipopolysaccharide biosynthesis protein [Bacteroidales bacterium]MBQ3188810.1 lipopolysaccharide biosynthesis protein [Bacteroidaceae bacterium]MBQ3623203.1 lipopolysaccharide biosynthesis protein [Bacteroidaceae bacterium]
MSKLQSLFKDTVIYGMSSIVGRFLNYLLVPLYSYAMTAQSGNYGIVTNIYAWTALILTFLTFGFETTFFRFANKSNADVSKVFSMSMQVVGTLSLLFLCAVFCNISAIANALDYTGHPEFITMMAVVVAIDAMQAILFGLIRYKKQAWKFAGLKLLFIVTSIALNLVAFLLMPWLYDKNPDFIGQFYDPDNQAYYIFLINLVCTLFVTIFLLPELKLFRFTCDTKLFKDMFAYSWPLLLLGLAGILNLHADKIIYTQLVPGMQGKVELSIYGAVVKVAAIMAMLIQAFRFAYEPFVFGSSSDKNSKALYAKAMKYFIIVAILAFLTVMFYIDIIRYLIAPDYWEGIKVIPIVMIAEIFMGIYFNLSFWYKLNDETYWGAIFSSIGCAILFAVNIIFVPKYGYMACAWASFAGYFAAMLLSYIIGQKRNPINYDIKSIAGYVAVAIILYAIYALLPIGNSLARIGCNTLLLAVYVIYFVKKDLPLKQIPFVKRFVK